jgi:uncharacterized membrane protein YGL010W
MKTLSTQLSTYKSVHLDSSNVKTHFIGIPLILWSAALALSTVQFELASAPTNLMQVIAALIFVYYLVLDLKMGVVAIALMAPIFAYAQTFNQVEYPLATALVVFFIGWVFQFIGHYYEKAKPAFFDDIKQLLIGPLFLVAEVCFAFGWFKQLESEVTKDAQRMRIELEHEQ